MLHTNKNKEIAVYIHWPYCKSKCPYCDFNSHVPLSDEVSWVERWVRAYQTSMASYHEELSGRVITSIFFGGGTPSLMPPKLVHEIIQSLSIYAQLDEQCEITLEANPTSSEAQKFKAFKAAGVNRISIGIQSLQEKHLKFLGREHSVVEAMEAIDLAKKTFARTNFDFIYALPDQALSDWQHELEEVLSIVDKHVSLYQLTIEKGTPFFALERDGVFIMPENEQAAEFYKLTEEMTSARGLPAYEISNYAALNEASRHNLTYWKYGDYLGIGPGAHGRVRNEKGVRVATVETHDPMRWLTQLEAEKSGQKQRELILPAQAAEEWLMVGLRLTGGIDINECHQKTGIYFDSLVSIKKLNLLQEEGLIALENGQLKASLRGRLVLNSLVAYLIDKGS